MDRTEDEQRIAGDSGAALHIALDAAGHDPAMKEDARAVLREQARLARMQADQLNEEGALMRWSLRMKHANEVMKFAFALAVALVLVAVVAALATAMWTASHDNGLVIEAFSVPPDLVQRGLGGEVIASQLLDKLARMQQQTNSIRPADTYRNNWGDDIKVEIPDTGISIGELNRYLRRWLGHETHITGEIFRTPSGLAVTARAREAGTTFTGKDADLDALLQKAAESIYAETQPYRYAAFLNEKGRDAEAMRVLGTLAAEAAPAERAWALSLLGNYYRFLNRQDEALATLRAAVAADPTNAHAWDNLASAEQSLDRIADGYRHTEQALGLYDNGSVAFDPDRTAIVKFQDRTFVAATLGDYATAEAMDEAIIHEPDRGGSQAQARIDEMGEAAAAHDFARARALGAAIHPANANERLNLWFESAGVAYLEKDWRTFEPLLDPRAIFGLAPAQFHAALQSILARVPKSLLAEAKAETGDIRQARDLIAHTPADCYNCLRMRGKIDAVAKNWDGAGFWFSRAVAQGAFIPTAWSDWGEMLLAKGDAAGAIVKLQAAAARGPRFADPLELWGEALMRENRSDLALAKFEQADRLAPNWGRLHLEWGDALFYLGRKDEARVQWARALQLDLSAADRARLTALRRMPTSRL
ncbi:MAG TPA: hypothetical protein VGI20_08875 [Rhizomicrobium sp.]